ncbi:MAG: antitoxin family protein [Planctomycetes bacterium]|nr:antitoxin family protein [Planctomycetota bacterium]
MKAIHAIYENGVFKPTEPVELPEASHVVFEPKIVSPQGSSASIDDVYALLSRRFNSGQSDVAARHDEHQFG